MRAALESEEPFGGVHVLFGGDFLQMKPSGGNPSLAIECKYGPNNIRGRKLWKECINEFMELKTNIRAQSEDGTTSQFARTCTNLRKGNPTTYDIAMLNSRLVNNLDTAVANASDLAVWIAATHKICNEINGKYFTNFVQAGKPYVRIIADHIPNKVSVSRPEKVERDKLYGISGLRGLPPPQLDFAIGTRVRITSNLSQSCGIVNGTMGTVYGFVYSGDEKQRQNTNITSNFSSLPPSEREIPIVLVQIDGEDTGPNKYEYSCSSTVPRLIPIQPTVYSRIKLLTNYNRVQLPLLASHARTGHSSQGLTAMADVYVYLDSMFFRGDYVGVSRTKSLQNLNIMNGATVKMFQKDAAFAVQVHKEYERLRSIGSTSRQTTLSTQTIVDTVTPCATYKLSEETPLDEFVSTMKIVDTTMDSTETTNDDTITPLSSLQKLTSPYNPKRNALKTTNIKTPNPTQTRNHIETIPSNYEGFKWKSNSCAFDTVIYILYTLYINTETSEAKYRFKRSIPTDLANAIETLTGSSRSSQQFEICINTCKQWFFTSRINTDADGVMLFIEGDLHNIQIVFESIKNRRSSDSDHILHSQFSISPTCEFQLCTEKIINKRHYFFKLSNYATQDVHIINQTILQDYITNEILNTSKKCRCNVLMTTNMTLFPEIIVFYCDNALQITCGDKGSNITYVNEDSMKKLENTYVDNKLMIRDKLYSLYSVAYFGNSHYLARTKMPNNDIVHYDGMRSLGKPCIITQHETAFPYLLPNKFVATMIFYKLQ